LQIVRPDDRSGEGVAVARDVWMFASRLSRHAGVARAFPDTRSGYLYVISGAVRANDDRLASGDAAYILGPGELRLEADEASELLLVDTPT
jgi:redox-sensitive bicupin YhaK (pirin superfamily)